MLDKNLKVTSGRITITEGDIDISGFDADGVSCRELVILASLWGSSRLLTDANMNIVEAGAGEAGIGTSCEWMLEDEDTCHWSTECGQDWSFAEGGPAENHIKFCFNCGQPVQFPDELEVVFT